MFSLLHSILNSWGSTSDNDPLTMDYTDDPVGKLCTHAGTTQAEAISSRNSSENSSL